MKKIVLGVLFSFIYFCSFSQKQNSNILPRPKLVVGIVIDQMRWDYLYRYYDRYGNGGFKRLLNEGFSCENTYIDYIPTVTAIGHGSIYTGSVPAIHGMAGNEFIVNATGKTMYCVEDTSVQTVGSKTEAGKLSPKNLLASTITDELKLATNFRSKVIGIALKDRGAILPAGHAANAAYWFDDTTGNWISSSFYMKDLPNWVKEFNQQKLPEKYLKQDWNTLFDIKTYVQSSTDENNYEGKFAGTTSATFPVKTSAMFSKNYAVIRTTPYGNSLTLDLAKAAIDNEQLGKSSVTDFLTVSCSATDYIGHQFGVNAIETEDTYLRLDRDLAAFLAYLDSKVGNGNYTVFLTADHGAGHNPTFLKDNNIPADFWTTGPLLRDLNKQLDEIYSVKNLALSLVNYQVHLNEQVISKNKLNDEAIRKDCVRFFRGKPGIAFVVDAKNLSDAAVPETIRNRIINGYNEKRSGPISIILEPGWYSASPKSTGTSHGLWSPYDAHIPLIFMGWGIKHGSINRPTNITDISPTLAALLHIQEPNGNIGKPISEVFK